jgi:hypothetical protein
MKDLSNILWAVIMVVLTTSVGYLINRTIEQKKENDRLSMNLEQYGLTVSTLELSKKELKKELGKRDARLLRADSIIKANGKRISQMERLISTRVVISDSDTIAVPIERGIPVYPPTTATTEQLYKSVFKTESKCISIEGFILSTDSLPSIAITRRQVTVNVDYITTKRRWWQFWKPKTEKIVSSDCGEVEILEINTTN